MDDIILTCWCSQCECFGDVSNSLDAPVGDDGDTKTPSVLWNFIHSCGLGSATCQHCPSEKDKHKERLVSTQTTEFLSFQPIWSNNYFICFHKYPVPVRWLLVQLFFYLTCSTMKWCIKGIQLVFWFKINRTKVSNKWWAHATKNIQVIVGVEKKITQWINNVS